MLMSASTSERLTINERLFDNSSVTPAVRAQRLHRHPHRPRLRLPRGPSRPFTSAIINHIQAGKFPCTESQRPRGANLGPYSVTFNNLPDRDHETLQAYKAFRLDAEANKFQHFPRSLRPQRPRQSPRHPPRRNRRLPQRPHRSHARRSPLRVAPAASSKSHTWAPPRWRNFAATTPP